MMIRMPHRPKAPAPRSGQRRQDAAGRVQQQSALQAMADKSPHVARLEALATESGPVQRMALFDAHKAGVDGNVVDANGFQTSKGFDDNHLVEGGGAIADDIVRFRGGRRDKGVKRNTVVTEAQLKDEVIDKGDEIENNIAADAVTTLDFPSGTAYQSIRDKGGAIAGLVNTPTVGIKARWVAADMVEIHHIHESEQQLDFSDSNAFPSLKR